MNILDKIREYVDTDVIIVLDNEQITEIDEDSKEILCVEGGVYSFESIEDRYAEDIMFYKSYELEMTYDIRDFIKDLKRSEKDLDKSKAKKMLVLEINERYLLNPTELEECYNFEFFENLNAITTHKFTRMKD